MFRSLFFRYVSAVFRHTLYIQVENFERPSKRSNERQSWYIIVNDYSRNHFVYSLKNQETGCVIDHSNTYGLRCIVYYGNSFQSWGIRDT